MDLAPALYQNPIYVCPEMKLRGLLQISTFMHVPACDRFIFSQDRSTYLARQATYCRLAGRYDKPICRS
jgi:hypothetical protein